MIMKWTAGAVVVAAVLAGAAGQGAQAPSPLRVVLVKQPFIPNGTSVGPTTMASGGIQAALAKLGATVRVNEIALTKEQEPEYGGWKRLGFATIPARDDGGLSIAALNRMILGAARGLQARRR